MLAKEAKQLVRQHIISKCDAQIGKIKFTARKEEEYINKHMFIYCVLFYFGGNNSRIINDHEALVRVHQTATLQCNVLTDGADVKHWLADLRRQLQQHIKDTDCGEQSFAAAIVADFEAKLQPSTCYVNGA